MHTKFKLIITLVLWVWLFQKVSFAQCKFIQISRGRGHSLAIASDGSLWAWGGNGYGQLGDGSFQTISNPVQIGTGKDWKFVCAGGGHSMAIKKDGSLWAWGHNDKGQLGLGHGTTLGAPSKVGNERWKYVSAGDVCSFGIKEDGSLWNWGYSYGKEGFKNYTSPSLLNNSRLWSSIQVKYVLWGVSGYVIFALSQDGAIWASGDNRLGRLGIGLPRDTTIPSLTRIGSENDWVYISDGETHAAAIKRDGSLWTWGDNSTGALGNGAFFQHRLSPTKVDSIQNCKQVITAGGWTIVLKKDGTLWISGAVGTIPLAKSNLEKINYFVQLGDDRDWDQISSNAYTILALKKDSSLWRWSLRDYPFNTCCQATQSKVTFPICMGDTLVFNNKEYYLGNRNNLDTILNKNGCDSIITVELVPFRTDTSELRDTLCYGQSTVLFGNYFDKAQSDKLLTVPNADQHGCDSTIRVRLHFLDSLHISERITKKQDSILISLKVTGGLPPYHYQWSQGDSTDQILILNDGIYTVTVTDSKNCSSVKIYYLKVADSKTSSGKKIQLFQDVETVTILSTDDIIKEIQIMDLNGRMIHTQSVSSEKFSFQKFNTISSLSLMRVILSDGSIHIFKLL